MSRKNAGKTGKKEEIAGHAVSTEGFTGSGQP